MKKVFIAVLFCFFINSHLYGLFGLVQKCNANSVEPSKIVWSPGNKFSEEKIFYLSAGENWGKSTSVLSNLKQTFTNAKDIIIDGGFLGFENVNQKHLDEVTSQFEGTVMSYKTPHFHFHPKKIYFDEGIYPFRNKLKRLAALKEVADNAREGEKPVVFDLTDFNLESRKDFVSNLEFYVDEAFMLVYLVNLPELFNKTRFLHNGKELSPEEATALLEPLSPQNFDIRDPKVWLVPEDRLYQELEALDEKDEE